MSLFPVKLADADRDSDTTRRSSDRSEATRDREPDRDLKIDDFSARLEAEPSEALKLNARPRIPEAERDREPDRDLNSELFSARLEAEPSEPVRDFARPLT